MFWTSLKWGATVLVALVLIASYLAAPEVETANPNQPAATPATPATPGKNFNF